MTMHKKLLLFIGLAISVVLAIGLFQYFEPAKDHGDQPIQKTLLATELHAAFASADSMELLAIGQVIAVQGTVQSPVVFGASSRNLMFNDRALEQSLAFRRNRGQSERPFGRI
jgi:hypothetical protein